LPHHHGYFLWSHSPSPELESPHPNLLPEGEGTKLPRPPGEGWGEGIYTYLFYSSHDTPGHFPEPAPLILTFSLREKEPISLFPWERGGVRE